MIRLLQICSTKAKESNMAMIFFTLKAKVALKREIFRTLLTIYLILKGR